MTTRTSGARAALVVALLVVGIGLALVGNSIGAYVLIADSEGDATFTVSNDDVTFSQDDEEVVVVEELESVKSVEVVDRDGQYVVETEDAEPFTEEERKQSIKLTQHNESVQSAIGDVEEYRFDVEPVQRLSVDGTEETPVEFSFKNDTSEIELDSEDGPAGETISVESKEVTEGETTVRVDHDPSYVEDEAHVTVTDPETGNEVLSVTVSLADDSVISITDWRTIGD